MHLALGSDIILLMLFTTTFLMEKKTVFKETLVYLMRAGCGVRWVAIMDAVVQFGVYESNY